jgi:hypothetical protein
MAVEHAVNISTIFLVLDSEVRGKTERVASLTLSRGSKSHRTHLYKLSNCRSADAFLQHREAGAYAAPFLRNGRGQEFTGAPHFPAKDNTAFA